MNIFKSQRVTSNSNNNNNNSNPINFKEKQNVIKNVSVTENEFPELCNTNIIDLPKSCLQYKNVSSLKASEEQSIEIIKEDVLPSGWRKIDKHFGYNEDKYGEEDNEESDKHYHMLALDVFKSLVNKWENERITFNNLYGEGEYERQYYIPNYILDEEYEYDETYNEYSES